MIKFAKVTTIPGLINDSDESAYREDVRCVGQWCDKISLDLNRSKTKEIIMDFRRSKQTEQSSLLKNGWEVERVESFKFHGVHISPNLTWSTHISHQVGKTQQRLYFLRKLSQVHLP